MELRRYGVLLWRWLWLIVLGSAVAGGAAYFTSKHQVPVYEASSMLLVSQSKAAQVLDITTVSSNGDRLAATYAELIHDEPVLAEVIRRLELHTTPLILGKAVKVTPIRNTQLIRLSVEDTNPAEAAAITNEIPKVFIQQNVEMQARRFADSKAGLQKQLEGAQGDMTRLQASIAQLKQAATVDQAELDRQQRDLSALQTSYATLYKSYEDLRLEEAKQLDTLLVTRQAQPPEKPIRPKTVQNTLLALVMGGLLALGIAYLVELLDDVIKNPDEIETSLGITALSAVPAVDRRAGESELAVLTDTHSSPAEAYRVLRTNLQFAAVDKELRSLLVTSASPGEGKTTTAANLGAALAQAGQRVILVDCDLHRPRLQRLFKVRNNTGITTALLNADIDLDNLLQETDVAGLRVLTSGPLPPNPAELLNSSHMRRILGQLQEHADIVVLDSPPTMALSDTAVLASRVDGVLLVLDASHTRRDFARRAVAGLRKVDARLVGAVLNRIPTRGAGSYYYHYYYSHYGRYYSNDNESHGSGGSGTAGGSGKGRGAPRRGFLNRLPRPLRAIVGAHNAGN